MTSLFISTPTYDGTVVLPYLYSALGLMKRCGERKIGVSFSYLVNSQIAIARNAAVRDFLASDATHLLFADADGDFDPDAVMAMLDTGHDVVAGSYPKKSIDWEAVRAAALRGEKNLAGWGTTLNFVAKDHASYDATTNCFEVAAVGTGLMLITRRCLEQMTAAHKDKTFFIRPGDTSPATAIFDFVIDDGHLVGEDFTFCRRWQALGGRIYVYLPALGRHVGTMTYEGELRTAVKFT